MARALSPKELADKLAKWEAAGFPLATVTAMKASLEPDAQESRSRIHNRTGKLARTVRVINPSSTVAKRRGAIVGGLSAGGKAAPYAGVIQRGGKVGAHVIRARGRGLAFPGPTGRPVVVAQVQHPGATIRAQDFLRVNEGRLVVTLDRGYQRSLDKEIG